MYYMYVYVCRWADDKFKCSWLGERRREFIQNSARLQRRLCLKIYCVNVCDDVRTEDGHRADGKSYGIDDEGVERMLRNYYSLIWIRNRYEVDCRRRSWCERKIIMGLAFSLGAKECKRNKSPIELNRHTYIIRSLRHSSHKSIVHHIHHHHWRHRSFYFIYFYIIYLFLFIYLFVLILHPASAISCTGFSDKRCHFDIQRKMPFYFR